jgi:hypothetical protein
MRFYHFLFLFLGLGILGGCEKTIDYNPADIPNNFTPLAAPADGYQMHLPAFPIPPQFEREFYVRLPLNNPKEFYGSGFEVKMRPGTHHLILYNFDDPKSPFLPPLGVIRDQNLTNNTLSISNLPVLSLPLFQAASGDFRIDLPKGYGFKVPANSSYDMNSHYFNKSDATRYGEIYANIYETPAADIKQELKVEYFQPVDLAIKPRATTVVKTDYMYTKETHFVMLTSHYHKRGKKFTISIKGGPRDGQEVYYSEDYEHPLWKTFQPELVLQPGEGLHTEATFVNETDRTIPFGVTSEDEMNFMIGFYYQK